MTHPQDVKIPEFGIELTAQPHEKLRAALQGEVPI